MELYIKFTINEMVRACNSGVLEQLAAVTKGKTEKLVETKENQPKTVSRVETASQLESKPQESEQAEGITIEDVRAAFMAKNSKANAAKLKAILNDHGVKKVTDLIEEDFASVIKKLEAI